MFGVLLGVAVPELLGLVFGVVPGVGGGVCGVAVPAGGVEVPGVPV